MSQKNSRSPAKLETNVRDQIVAAASAEFAASGLPGASVRSIASRAGVTAAMINYYYGTKNALYDVVVERAQARLFAQLSQALGQATAADLPAALAAAYFDFLSEERDLQRLLLREVLDEGDGVQTLVRKYLDPLRAALEAQLGNDGEAFQTAISIFGAVAGYFIYAPVLAEVLAQDPLAEQALAQRRRHVISLARLMTQPQEP